VADRRIAITGLGMITPAAIGVGALWDAIVAGKSAIRRISLFDPSNFACQICGQLDDFSARNYVPKDYRKAVKVMARDIEIAVAAADLAFRDSGIVTRGIDPASVNIDPRRLGCNIGAGLILPDLNELGLAVLTALDEHGKFDMKLWGSRGMNNLTPLWLLKYLPNMLSCHVTIIHGAEAPSNCITCGDASGILSIGEAGRLIARGGADAVVAGGAEAKLTPQGLVRQTMLKRVCTTGNDNPASAIRPFDKDHAGTAIGEGGGVAILEEMARAQVRGARIHAELVGFGAACDPTGIDILKPNAGALDLAVKKALKNAGITPDQVGMIMAHGTGVPGEDVAEVAAWKAALGESAARIPACALTGSSGSLYAGAGAASVSIAAMALQKQVVPPTINFASPAADCGLNLSSQPREAKFDYVVCGSFTIGGQSAACVLKKV
jgi:3-oxoacyl-[acyl-carrier-protein] synthase II